MQTPQDAHSDEEMPEAVSPVTDGGDGAPAPAHEATAAGEPESQIMWQIERVEHASNQTDIHVVWLKAQGDGTWGDVLRDTLSFTGQVNEQRIRAEMGRRAREYVIPAYIAPKTSPDESVANLVGASGTMEDLP